ncbi:hypothetical protein TIFTF001_031236 [Ficus carica]|uniref:Sulfiredoxin n=1 Tax=Ficus carica TaxID=3494 RepID=A0AA88E0N3_FICCA|nr:hypothetical protein TIFTF001_031236 [Ficus carica]
MANFILRVPNSFRTFSACASSNGAVGPTSSRPGPVVVEIPLEKIRRPLMRTRANDPDKVKDLMDSISQIGLQVPVHLPPNGTFACWFLSSFMIAIQLMPLPSSSVLKDGVLALKKINRSWNSVAMIDVLEVDGVYYEVVASWTMAASPVVIAMKLINALASLQSVVKFAAEQKKL